MSVFGYQKNGSSWVASQNGQTNLLYLGSKALSFAENNVGSSTTATFWPYGGVNTSGSGPGGFASYWGDWSGSYYADQRYYDYTWGRFVTADPSDGNLSFSNSGSWNRYAYVNGDPINGMDSRGLYEYDDGGDGEDDYFVDGPQGGSGDGGDPTFSVTVNLCVTCQQMTDVLSNLAANVSATLNSIQNSPAAQLTAGLLGLGVNILGAIETENAGPAEQSLDNLEGQLAANNQCQTCWRELSLDLVHSRPWGYPIALTFS